MTMKEAIQAMLDGKAVRSKKWIKPKYVFFDGSWFKDDLGSEININLHYDEDFEIYEKLNPKQVVVIEKWLIYDNLSKSYSIAEESNIDCYISDDRAYLSKVKLLDTYEVEI